MDDQAKKLWLKIDSIVKQLAHLKYWTVAEKYHSEIIECYDRLRNVKNTIEEAK